ncbi:MAG: transcription antitermination factor NusB [Epsilonproteobacteria bacterium]|nr:transcription antitermination factor NusB [Campylobacterota bacterium]
MSKPSTTPNDHLEETKNTQEYEIDPALEMQQAEQELAAFFTSISTRRDQRRLSFYLVYIVDRFDYSITADDALADLQEGFDFTLPADSYARTLADSVINASDELDRKISPYLKNWKLERLGCATRLILRLALWELLHTDNAPSVVINEAIELSKMFAERDSYRFVNGILDELHKSIQEQNKKDA